VPLLYGEVFDVIFLKIHGLNLPSREFFVFFSLMFNQITQTFIDLVKIDSPTGDELKMAKFVMEKLAGLGIVAEMDAVGNVTARVKGDARKEVLLLSAHLDTVEPGRGIEPVVEPDGRIHSKGNTILGADNKASIAAIFEVLSVFEKEDYSHNHPIDLVFTVGEEYGSRGVLGLDYGKIRAKRGYIFDSSDGEIGDIEIAAPFYNKLEIWLTGRASHSMDPELGTNVLPVMASAMTKITLGRVNDGTLVNLGIITAGTGVNVIPADVEVIGEVRSFDEEELENTTKEIFDTFVDEAKNKGIEVETAITREYDGYEFSTKDEFLLETKENLRKIGLEPSTLKVWGCSDGSIFNQHGIKVLNLVDGGRDSHSVDEEITVKELKKLAKVIQVLVG